MFEETSNKTNYPRSSIMQLCDFHELVSMSKFVFPLLNTPDTHICGRDMSSEPLEVETFNLMVN